jgi:uncharacterized surface protein with fasciclin (FAS1) repeats
MFSTKKKVTAALTLTLASAFLLSACSMGSDAGSSTEESSKPMTSESSEPTTETMDPAANLVGAGCAAYADAVPDGAGSVEGMSKDPVAVAASNNPLLTTLTLR